MTFEAGRSDHRLAIFWAPPQQGLWPHLTVREHLTTVLPPSNVNPTIVADDLLAKFDLLDHAAARPDSLSLGERSRLNVARALPCCSGRRGCW